MKKKIGLGILIALAIVGFISLCGMAREKIQYASLEHSGWVKTDSVSGLDIRGDVAEVKLLNGKVWQAEYSYDFHDSIYKTIYCHLKLYYWSEAKQSMMLNYYLLIDDGCDGILDAVDYLELPTSSFFKTGDDVGEYVCIKDEEGKHIPSYWVTWDSASKSSRAAEIFAEAENIYSQLPIRAVVK